MANIKSQIKRNRQNERRRQNNKATRSELKTRTKRFLGAVEAGDAAAAQEALASVNKRLDQAAAKGVIHKRKAANQKARLAKRLSSK
ncbi:MAG: 30S ribosomal protein S20 [Actinomycetota bacterium]